MQWVIEIHTIGVLVYRDPFERLVFPWELAFIFVFISDALDSV